MTPKEHAQNGASMRLGKSVLPSVCGPHRALCALTELNTMEQGPFIEALGWIFEHSPWVAERAWKSKPFSSVEALHGAMVHEVDSASSADQLALICAHPDLGAKAKMSDASMGEQAGAGLDQLSVTEFQELRRLNAEYLGKFGFPFIHAVKGATKEGIMHALGERLLNDVKTEWSMALGQIARIAWFRLSGELL
jgi:OHCU decarboxylase